MEQQPDKNYESEQGRIERLAELKLGVQQRAELVLVLLGKKPATELSFYSWSDTVEDVERALDDVRLLHARKPIPDAAHNAIAYLAVAREQDTLERLVRLQGDAVDSAEYGRLMGFPETAIQAFVNGEAAIRRSIAPETSDTDFRLQGFGLSPAHWEEELRLEKEWNDAIKEKAPSLWEEMGAN